jgi:peroxin-11B
MSNQEFVGKLIRYLDTHNGRDKICRLLQYGSRFLAWWLIVNSRPELSKRISNLEQSSSMARKIFRLAKSIAHIQAILKTLEDVCFFALKS